jgi:glycosyltransferase involved in cell wall biosynthesis
MKLVVSAVAAKRGGVANYLVNLLRWLPGPESGHEFVVFLSPELAQSQPTSRPNVRLVPLPLSRAPWWRRLWWDQVTLRRFLDNQGADALFSSANFGMFRCPVRQILLVRMPLYFSRPYLDLFLPRGSLRWKVAFRFRRWLCCQSVRAADVVMTPTQAMLDDLRQFVEVDGCKALVNHYGVDLAHFWSPAAQGCTPTARSGSGPVVRLVYVSLYAEHKNLSTLLGAMPLLNRSDTAKFLLKTPVDPFYKEIAWMATVEDDLRLARRPDVAPWVEFLGPLNPQQIGVLYREADLFVFPSLCESFGHPMAEAMAHGLPIVASDMPVNREVCGDAAIYFDPLSAEHLAQQIRGLVGDPQLMAKLGATGRERAATLFTWDRHIQRILERVGGPQERRTGPHGRH